MSRANERPATATSHTLSSEGLQMPSLLGALKHVNESSAGMSETANSQVARRAYQ